jgi:hypothetical protein
MKPKINVDLLITAGAALAGAVVFLFATFTTFGYVDAKNESTKEILTDIRDTVKRVDERVYELTKERGN